MALIALEAVAAMRVSSHPKFKGTKLRIFETNYRLILNKNSLKTDLCLNLVGSPEVF